MVIRAVWPTAEGRPFFANLKVMRATLQALEAALGPEARVRAWVFLEDRFGFVAEGPDTLPDLLETARSRAEERFRAQNGQGLWGAVAEEVEVLGSPVAVVRPLAELLLGKGFADSLSEYPWCGGGWLLGSGDKLIGRGGESRKDGVTPK
ncbi:hypothetical protein [Deferrisoma camini]|uniref:hypothetical protein n=1 Tax=Deferrisoma camini TaxID=1035120 RepID=UPI00046CF99C|nr:hypothetical protein [Deferrisoma camini]